ncbi:MAG: glutathione peroxidase [Alphaproteobacteria bacterium]
MFHRRHVLALPLLATPALTRDAQAQVQASSSSAYAFSFDGLNGEPIRLGDHAGKVMLVVNTASKCGFTNQYADLQALWERNQSRGFVVIGVPSDDFNQERGSNREIAAFCQAVYGVSFPMAGKTHVTGSEAHPFYRWAARERPADTPRWNFHKYVVGRSGRLAGAFTSHVRPSDPRITAVIEAQLASA